MTDQLSSVPQELKMRSMVHLRAARKAFAKVPDHELACCYGADFQQIT